jgi:7-carboxy-7-deazaguanine synthase (Cx14CxxC type)
MSYAVKEVFRTLQGEGGQSGRVAVFCRFTGCNLWSGREHDRSGAACTFCDTDFVGTDGSGGGRFNSAADLAEHIERVWGQEKSRRFVVFTGGEPLLQLDSDLLQEVKRRGFETAVETNGTLEAPMGLDWVCVSPKEGTELVQCTGNELKVVYPQRGLDLEALGRMRFDQFWVSPMDGPDRLQNVKDATAYCLANPRWRLNIQMHKAVGIQ